MSDVFSNKEMSLQHRLCQPAEHCGSSRDVAIYSTRTPILVTAHTEPPSRLLPQQEQLCPYPALWWQVATVPPDQKASFCHCHQRVQVCRATHRYWSGAGLPTSFWQLAPPPRLGRITELTPHSTTPQVKSVQTSQTPDIAFLCF